MAVILVTGASGQLGNELKTEAENYRGYEFIFTDADTLDITDYEKTSEFIQQTEPGWIINCAAYNLVDKAETEPEKAILINTHAVRNLAKAIKGTSCRLIHVSTDYVFEGSSNSPYNEMSPVNPLSAYGRSKLGGEKEALQHSPAMVIRTSWLYSSFGNNFVKTIISNADRKDTLNVVFDQTGSPTYAADLAAAIMNIVASVIRNRVAFTPGLYHYSNEGVCSWYDFAVEIVAATGQNCTILPILTSGYPTPAKRPVYSVMDKTRIKETYGLTVPHWRDSLVRCITKLKQSRI